MMQMQVRLCAFIAATIAVTACSGVSTPSAPSVATPAPPAVVQTITNGITANAGLESAITGPDGRVWFEETDGNRLLAIDVNGTATEYPLSAKAAPLAITAGADGNLWTGGFLGNLYRVTTSGVVTTYALPNAHVGGLVLGADGNVWFTDYGDAAVAYITPSGAITSYPAGVGARPYGIARGADGNYWVSDLNGSILRVTPTGTITPFATGIKSGAMTYIVAGPDGNLYFGVSNNDISVNDAVERITTSGSVSTVATLAPKSDPEQFVVGADGNIYFSEGGVDGIGRIDASGTVTQIPLAITKGTVGLAAGPDHQLWLGGLQTVYRVSY